MSFSAHNYFLRPTKVSDLPFYRSMMQNPDWLDNSGFSLEDFKRDDQLLRFMSPKDSFGFCGIVIDKINNNEIGFCHFVQVKNNVAECTGGLIKEIHNHGHGISAYACCINDFFFIAPTMSHNSVLYNEIKHTLFKNEFKTWFPIRGY